MFKKYLTILLKSSENKIVGIGLLLLRTGISTLMVYLHGWPKLKSYSESQSSFPELIGLGSETGLLLAIFAEAICSILLSLGLLTRIAVIPLSFTMVVAAFIFNADQEFIVKEKGIIYLIVYLFFLITGAGKYSADQILLQKINSIKQ
ncbi:DoxX family protein [Mangrovivirga sp. M17]|uniref:DoxX family protein n=1 Tax=Mangrovivirga halotolerans TaxID=2993936 RepID=A0ABT3RUJ1_9BACT|nr:DoxX family protein [Mangrovivirga halotolerans]MCX2745439.1 DoxX family protein [Mangrovivirga halotolerans]